MSTPIEIRLPDIGDFAGVPIIEVHVAPGDQVAADDPIVTLESDKATMDVPAPQAGTVRELRVGVGDEVSEGDLLLLLDAAGAAGAPAGGLPAKERVHESAHPTAPGPAGYGSPAGVYERLEVRVPDIGDYRDVPVIEVHVAAGDTIAAEDPLITLESDKATMDVPAPAGGTVTGLRVAVGDTVSEGDMILELQTGEEEAAPPAPAATAQPVPAPVAASAAGIEADVQAEVLVLGAGPGGYSAAFRAADLGKSVVLVDRSPILGGVCLNVGCIPSKALLHAARVIAETKEMAEHGLAFGEPAAMIACSKLTVRLLPSGRSTSSWFSEVNRPTPWTVVTLRALASPARPPVSFLTTPSFQPRRRPTSISGVAKPRPCSLISLVSAITLAACRSAFEGMQPTLRHTPPRLGQRSTSTTCLPRSAARNAAV